MVEQQDFLIRNGELVSYLGNATDIIIPDCVHSIGMGAFIERKNVRSVILPKSLHWIGQSAFAHCKKLKSIVIPASVTFIDKCAFLDSGLEEIVIEGKPEIRLWAFDGTPWKANEFKKHGGLVRDNVLLSVNPKLTEYVIPPEVKIIGQDAFKNSKIKKIEVPTGVTKLDVCAFSCSEVEHISLPDTLNIIESHAFSNCKKLTELTIPKSVTVIDSRAFDELPNCVLTILNESDDEELFRISEEAFGWDTPHVKEVRVPQDSVAMRYAMKVGLKVTTFPSSPKNASVAKKYTYVGDTFCCLGDTLHEYFGQEDVVYVPEGIHAIGARAFSRSKVKKIYLPRSVKTIAFEAFDNCKQLERIIGDGVEEVERHAFYGCEELTRVEFPHLQLCFDVSFEECNSLKRKDIIIPDNAVIIMESDEPRTCACGYCHIIRTPFTPIEVEKRIVCLRRGASVEKIKKRATEEFVIDMEQQKE